MALPLYFAYGSNLNLPDFNLFCARHGFTSDLISPVSAAVLSDHRLEFSHYSKSRGGGALNLARRVGSFVDGVLFRVSGVEGWAALDHKEGAPERYQRIEVKLDLPVGESKEAITYIVKNPRAKYFPPTEHYVSIVEEGLKAFGLCRNALHQAARGAER